MLMTKNHGGAARTAPPKIYKKNKETYGGAARTAPSREKITIRNNKE